ncbi:MAG: signal peptidase I [Candidatus Aminicenantes bacterium]|nr:signal peptidase I [Candidatus Aminicenantes bacterium]
MNKQKKSKQDKKEKKSTFRDYFELIVETALFVFFVMTFVVQAFQIPTGSMEDTLLVGDFLLVNKFAYAEPLFPVEDFILPNKELERGDIVVFKYPKQLSKDFVKRLIATEGDEIRIENKQVLINGNPISEDYKIHNDAQVYNENNSYHYDDYIRDNFGPFTVPPGQCFVLGDNRDNSLDSRYWGTLPLNYIKGKPWIIYFSYKAERDAYLKNGIKDRLKRMVKFITLARWGRMFKIIH